MQSTIITLKAGPSESEASAIVPVADIVVHLAFVQKNREVVLLVNPIVEDYDQKTLTLRFDKSTRFKIFDVHKRTTECFEVDGRKYEIEFITWARPTPDTLRLDFEVRYD